MKTQQQVTEKQAMKAAYAKAVIVDESNALMEFSPAGFIHNVRLIAEATGKSFVQVVEGVKEFACKDQQRKKELARLKRGDELEYEQQWEQAMPSFGSFLGNRNSATN